MKKVIKIAGFYIAAGLLVFILYNISTDIKESRDNKILNDYSKVIGELVYVNPGSEAFSMSLKYKYVANGSTYYRIVEVDRNKRNFYKKLIWDSAAVNRLRFWVIYANQEPSISLVDLDNPFDHLDVKEFPNDLSQFK
jgi:hypothetical protein